MDELTRIKKLIADHYDGIPWIDVSISATIRNLSASQASEKIENLNSIWQIVNHMIQWRVTVCKKLKGGDIYVNENNFFEEVSDTSEENWLATLENFDRSQNEIMAFIKSLNNFDYDNLFSNGHTSYEHLQAILQHDAYHLGQIVILKKLINNNIKLPEQSD